MTNEWIPNPGTGVNPVREGETLVAVRFRDGDEHVSKDAEIWGWKGGNADNIITHYRVSPPRTAAPIAKPAIMSADEVLIRAREAVIETFEWTGSGAAEMQRGNADGNGMIKAILVYERDRAKPLAEVAPHTAEDPDERAAYEASITQGLYNPGSRPSFEAWRETVLGKAMIATFRAGKAAR